MVLVLVLEGSCHKGHSNQTFLMALQEDQHLDLRLHIFSLEHFVILFSFSWGHLHHTLPLMLHLCTPDSCTHQTDCVLSGLVQEHEQAVLC